MCGITGIVDFNSGRGASPEALARMTEVMAHRGPDDSGYHTGPCVGLGHRRLSIIDLAAGHQPMYDDEETRVIVFNGEIYNYEEIRKGLASLGVRFRTNSDTEVLLKSYARYGVECLQLLRGMFAFAIWDNSARNLFIARDRLGKKPLYYANSNGRLVFGSEIKSILAAGEIERAVNPDAVDSFLSLGYTLAPQTAIKGIYKLPAGHYLLFDDRGLTIEQYWRLHEHDRRPKLAPAEGIELVKDTLDKAVSLRMISDVPIGAYLSGGLDSSIIVGIMSKFSAKPVRTFTIGYENAPAHSELEYAKVVANHFGTDHMEIILKPRGLFDLLNKMVLHLEEPIGDQACIPLFLISKEAKNEVTVMLSGEGADEIFGGYNIYVFMRFIALYGGMPHSFRRGILNPLVRRLLDERRAEKYLEWTEKCLTERYLGAMADLSGNIREQLYSRDFSGQTSRSFQDTIESYYREVEHSRELDRMMYLDTKTWLVEDLLLKADKMTMAAAIELRTPFLDHELVELSRRLPLSSKIRGLQKKKILREAYKDFLPAITLRRSKKGFPVPLSLWFREDLNDLISEVLLSRQAVQRGYFNPRFIESMLGEQRRGKLDYSKTLWNLVVLEFWFRNFIDGTPA